MCIGVATSCARLPPVNKMAVLFFIRCCRRDSTFSYMSAWRHAFELLYRELRSDCLMKISIFNFFSDLLVYLFRILRRRCVIYVVVY